jgi:hypothetical protein
VAHAEGEARMGLAIGNDMVAQGGEDKKGCHSGKQAVLFEKRTKNFSFPDVRLPRKADGSFLLLFFKKEALTSLRWS